MGCRAPNIQEGGVEGARQCHMGLLVFFPTSASPKAAPEGEARIQGELCRVGAAAVASVSSRLIACGSGGPYAACQR